MALRRMPAVRPIRRRIQAVRLTRGARRTLP
jgi:hypothetical protein